MKVFSKMQQKTDILHETYCVPDIIKSTAQKCKIDPVQIRQWKKKLSSLNLESEDPTLTFNSRNTRAKKTFHIRKPDIDTEHYNAYCSIYDALQLSGQFVL